MRRIRGEAPTTLGEAPELGIQSYYVDTYLSLIIMSMLPISTPLSTPVR